MLMFFLKFTFRPSDVGKCDTLLLKQLLGECFEL